VSSRVLLFLLLILACIPSALAVSRTCTRTLDPPRINQDTRFCADNFFPDGLSITHDNIMLDCGTAVLKGRFKTAGLTIQGRENITIKDCQLANYEVGILIKNSKHIVIRGINLLRNNIGLKIIDSTGIAVENGYDISLQKPIQLINSKGNVFSYTNKRLEGETCRLNQCNLVSGMVAHEQQLEKASGPSKTLSRILRDNVRAWLAI